MPVPLLGFPFRVLPPAEQYGLSTARTLLWLVPKDLHFRVLLPASVLSTEQQNYSADSDPHGLRLLRGVFLFAGDPEGSFLSWAF
jgi:hypothetical protein